MRLRAVLLHVVALTKLSYAEEIAVVEYNGEIVFEESALPNRRAQATQVAVMTKKEASNGSINRYPKLHRFKS